MARVVPSGSAAPHRTQGIAQRTVAEEVERLVGDLELYRPAVLTHSATLAALALLLFGVEIGRRRDEALFHHPLDDLLNQILELLARLFLIAVRGLAEQLLQ